MDLCGFRAGLSVNRRKDFYVVYLKDAEAREIPQFCPGHRLSPHDADHQRMREEVNRLGVVRPPTGKDAAGRQGTGGDPFGLCR